MTSWRSQGLKAPLSGESPASAPPPSWPLQLGRTGLSKVSFASSSPLACFELWSPYISSLMRNRWLHDFKVEMRFLQGFPYLIQSMPLRVSGWNLAEKSELKLKMF